MTTMHGTRRAVLYARVSSKKQADEGYSLDQQIDALRELAAKEGYKVLEEVRDPGYSGKTLDRPGLQRVKELVSGGGVDAVLIQDRDRLSREPAYTFMLRQEFEKFGTVIRDPSGRNQENPTDELTTNIIDSVAKFERQLTAIRMKRGKTQAVKKGRVLATRSPAYGFKLTDDRKGYVVNEDTMPTVRRIVGMVADGVSLGEVVRTLNMEGTPSPQGGRWAKPVIRNILKNPAYEPHPAEEVAGMVEPEVAAGLERGRSYGLWHYDGIPVPIPESGIERDVVLRARSNIAGNRAPSNTGRRLWTLSGGIARCPECGGVLEPHSAPRPTKTYLYYRCRRRHGNGAWACTYTRGLSAEAFEESVWE